LTLATWELFGQMKILLGKRGKVKDVGIKDQKPKKAKKLAH